MTSFSGIWKPSNHLHQLYYGSGCVEHHLVQSLPSTSSRVFIITGQSLHTKTPLVADLEHMLGHRHAGTFFQIRQHGPIADVDNATDTILHDSDVDCIVLLGGGSVIDTAKVVSLRAKERRGRGLTHLAIPTTLSASECTAGGGFTRASGVKVGFRDPVMGISAIFYDPRYAAHTPRDLWLGSGVRALDHAVECMYPPHAAEVPWKALSQWAVGELFECLPIASKKHPATDEDVTLRLMLAAYASSGLKGENLQGGMGLSHSLGYALGSPYDIPHGITSCMTLGKVVQLKARESESNAKQIARLSGPTGGNVPGEDDLSRAVEVGVRIERLVTQLGLALGTLTTRGVPREERELIVERALGGRKDDTLFGQVLKLVDSLY